jgi:hypothetical protein
MLKGVVTRSKPGNSKRTELLNAWDAWIWEYGFPNSYSEEENQLASANPETQGFWAIR